jgi:hypothetical protein
MTEDVMVEVGVVQKCVFAQDIAGVLHVYGVAV